jgi:nucleoside-diphosphate-sugar epimerase
VSASSVGFERLARIGRRVHELEAVVACDLAGSDAVASIERVAPDVILHLAADAWVPRSFSHPREVVSNNVQSTLNVLAAAASLPELARVVVTSSSEIYGTARTPRIAESHPLEPTSPYAASKVACDRLASAWRRTFDIPVSIIRPFNTYGPRHTYDVIPRFIRAALTGEPLTVHGSGEQSRDFTYVDDMVEGFLSMGAHPEAIGRAVNFGRGQATTVRSIAEMIVDFAESPSRIVHTPPRAAEVDRLCCDPGLANELFGWSAKVDIADGLHRNIRWAREMWT